MQTILCLPDYLVTPPTTQEDLPTGRPIFSCRPSFYFGSRFWDRTSFLDAISSLHSNTEPGTSFLNAISASFLNESCDGDVEDETLFRSGG